MKKVFTLVLAMTIVMTSFAQFKSVSRKSVKHEMAKMQAYSGFEERDAANLPMAPRYITTNPEVEDLSYTTYDWQSNAGARNFTAVWPDGFAVMCYTQATTTNFSDRGTGLAIWDPAVGEWEYTESRVEGIKTGFGSIARYGENGLVIAAHTATELRIFIVEDFRQGNRDFGEGIVLPMASGVEATHPAVQCSGQNLDIVHVLAANFQKATPYYNEAIFYWRYENGEWTKECELLPSLDADHITDGGTNNYVFLLCDPAKPNRVSFMVNSPWCDGKAVISEDNGDTWTDKVYFQHPDINYVFPSEGVQLYYPRWTAATFDNNDHMHVVYEYNGTNGGPGDGGYFTSVGGIGYWNEVLPKNEMCIGGIGNVGEPFIIDTTYISKDLYESEWYWSDANHDPLPEYIGELEIVDEDGHVISRESSEGYWIDNNTWGDHGAYNSGKAAFPSIFYDKNTNMVYAFWSQIAGDEESVFWDTDLNLHFYRVFCNVSSNGGLTWEGTKMVLTNDVFFEGAYDEMVYGQVIPYLYHDSEGDYMWYCYQRDTNAGTYVQDDETNPDDNLYSAIKVYTNFMWDDVEENTVAAPVAMKVYPNPAQGTFAMELNQEADVEIYNAVGQLVKTYKDVKTLNVNLEAGIYFVKAGNETQKVVVF